MPYCSSVMTITVLLPFFIGGSVFFSWLWHRGGRVLPIVVVAHVGAHLNNSHLALPDDVLPAVAHTIVYAGLAFPSIAHSIWNKGGVFYAYRDTNVAFNCGALDHLVGRVARRAARPAGDEDRRGDDEDGTSGTIFCARRVGVAAEGLHPELEH